MIEQIKKTGRNDDNTLGIPRANLELKHMFILHSQYVHTMVICASFISVRCNDKSLNEISLN